MRRNHLIYARSTSNTNEDIDDESDDRHLFPLLSNQASDSEDNLLLMHFLRNPSTPATTYGAENANNNPTMNTPPSPSTPYYFAQHKVIHKRNISDFTSSDNLLLSHLKKCTKHNDIQTQHLQNAQYRDKAISETVPHNHIMQMHKNQLINMILWQ